jgi:thioredoxin 1
MRPHSGWMAVWVLALLAGGSSFGRAQGVTSAAAADTVFAPLQQWKSAILTGDTGGMRALYSSDPGANFATTAGKITPDGDVAFWTGLKVRKLRLNVSQSDASLPGIEKILFVAEVRSILPSEKKTLYVTEEQVWQKQGAQWLLVVANRTNAAHLEQPASVDNQIYGTGDARGEIKHELGVAAKGHKRVLVVFGANWCYDCHVLDLAFHRPDLASLLEHDYEVVHVDIGRGDKNQDLMQQYDVPMKKGIPAIAVLDANGKLLFSQKTGEFSNARALAPDDLLGFLNKWKPQAR